MPMQVVFPTTMVAVGLIGAGALLGVAHNLRFHKTRRPVMTDAFDDAMIERDVWVRKQNKIIKEMRAQTGIQ